MGFPSWFGALGFAESREYKVLEFGVLGFRDSGLSR